MSQKLYKRILLMLAVAVFPVFLYADTPTLTLNNKTDNDFAITFKCGDSPTQSIYFGKQTNGKQTKFVDMNLSGSTPSNGCRYSVCSWSTKGGKTTPDSGLCSFTSQSYGNITLNFNGQFIASQCNKGMGSIDCSATTQGSNLTVTFTQHPSFTPHP